MSDVYNTAVESEVEQIDHVLGEEYEHMPVPLLGILVPPIGAIILVDQYMVRANSEATSEWRIVPFIAWAAGSLVAFFVSEYAPQYSTAISAFVVAGVAYGVLQSLAAPKTQYAS
jgi:cytosine permease